MIEDINVFVGKQTDDNCFIFNRKTATDMFYKIKELINAVNELEKGLKEVKEKDYLKAFCGEEATIVLYGEKQPETKPVIETEYIDKGEVFDTMYDLLFDEKRIPTKQDILAVIENAPAEEVEKVKHAEWLNFKKQNKKFLICSECRAVIDVAVCQIDENEFDFCPYCNAKMDLKGVVKNG